MAVSIEDVRHVAALARLGLAEERLPALAAQLNTILEHMEMLARVKTAGVIGAAGVGAGGTPLREDAGRPIPLARGLDEIAPRMRQGFFLVPRLASHDEPGGSMEDE